MLRSVGGLRHFMVANPFKHTIDLDNHAFTFKEFALLVLKKKKKTFFLALNAILKVNFTSTKVKLVPYIPLYSCNCKMNVDQKQPKKAESAQLNLTTALP